MDARVVIADAPSPSRHRMAHLLHQSGFHVETASDALECLGKLRWLEPEILVVGLELSWGGAAAVVAFLNESHFELRIPTIIVVGDAPPAVLARRTGVPLSACFQKPLRLELLLDRVGLAMARIDLRKQERLHSPAPVSGQRKDESAPRQVAQSV